MTGDSVADELYGAEPGEFVARRDAMAKELRASGDRTGADAVKKLRKPSVSAAVVNRLARAASDDVSALLAAGEALRQAQLGGGDRDAIRAAARDEREAVETLVSQAGRASPAVLEEVRSTLHAAASDDEARELIRRGVLTEARQAAGFGGFPAPSRDSEGSKQLAGEGGGEAKPRRKGGGAASSGSSGRAPAGSGRAPASSGRAPAKAAASRPSADEAAAARERAAAERKAEAERKKAVKERVRAAKAALRDAEKDAKAAERERVAAEKALAKATREAERASGEVTRRREELEAAERA